jgi:hypothetical protein
MMKNPYDVPESTITITDLPQPNPEWAQEALQQTQEILSREPLPPVLELIEDAADCFLGIFILYPELATPYYKKIAGRLFQYIDENK